jgi:hypothetical protein
MGVPKTMFTGFVQQLGVVSLSKDCIYGAVCKHWALATTDQEISTKVSIFLILI